jgi:flagellar protein FliS
MYDVRSRYLADTVATAAPSRLLTMLFDRLALDVERAEAALLTGRRADANQQLTHGQDIVVELMSSLDMGTWEGAPGLMSVYTFLYSQLVEAFVKGDAEQVARCREIIAPLHDAWHEAAGALVQPVIGRPVAPLQSAGLGVLGVA